ncbi:PP2C family protein-serine/threonine phosphatase [Amycolatopsis nigrescens]|uniref:PP2C family protein-serine/threonine phosphatase n=1 Tax=Amycolatopsis nigrescens TaxID=381445 RepID=UPI00037BB38D|nr:PP2C family protein-serine/threonine phosphatase [Amycolatopsis nigrescens]
MHSVRPPEPDHTAGTDWFLAEVGRRLRGSLDSEHTASVLAELAVPELADCAIVVLPTPRGRLQWWRRDADGGQGRGRTRKVAAGSAPVFTAAMTCDGAEIRTLPPQELPDLPSALADPLRRFGQICLLSLLAAGEGSPQPGLLVLAYRTEARRSGDQLERAIQEFAAHARGSLSAAHRYRQQKDAVAALAGTLALPVLPVVQGARMAAVYEPAPGVLEIGGDFYDVHPRADGSALVVLGDVCGHGAEAAGLTGRVRSSLAALHLVERDGERLLHLLNEALIATGSSRFATVVLGSMYGDGGGILRLELASGGHPAPLVVRRSGAVEDVDLAGMLVGISPHARFAGCTVELADGDLCLLYTDGVTEARNHLDRTELFGAERLRTLVSACAGMPAEGMAEYVRDAVRQWLRGADHDDIALLVIQGAS